MGERASECIGWWMDIYICTNMCVRGWVDRYIHVYVCMDMHVFLCIYVSVILYMHTCIRLCLFVCVCVCVQYNAVQKGWLGFGSTITMLVGGILTGSVKG